MKRTSQPQPQPRAVYDGPSRPNTRDSRDTSVSTRDTSATPTIPKHIAAQSASVQVAWIMGQTSPPPTVEIDHDAFSSIEVSLEEAYAWASLSTYEPLFGPQNGYDGRSLLEALSPDHPAVHAAATVVRCQKYEQTLQEQAPALGRQIDLAYQAASDAAYATIADQVAKYEATARQLVNDPRYGDRPSTLPRPEPPEADLTAVRKLQKQVDRLADEIVACRRRRDAAMATVSATLSPLSESLCQLLWIGPAGTPERPDWSLMNQSWEVLGELLGGQKADELFARAEKRWGSSR